jgi:hypothetical protein
MFFWDRIFVLTLFLTFCQCNPLDCYTVIDSLHVVLEVTWKLVVPILQICILFQRRLVGSTNYYFRHSVPSLQDQGSYEGGLHPHKVERFWHFLLQRSICLPTQRQLHGDLEPIPFPNLNDLEWLLLDMSTNEAFKAKMPSDFQRISKVATGSHMENLQCFIPMHVLIDFFAVSNGIKKTVTLLKDVQPEEALYDRLMDVD